MAGEASEDGPTGDPREFLSKTRWQRFQVLVMGPTMNLLLAFLLLAGMLYQGAEVASYSDQPVNVGLVKAGFTRGARRHPDRRSHRDGGRSSCRDVGGLRRHDRHARESRGVDRAAAQRPRRHEDGHARRGRQRPLRTGRHRRAAERASASGGHQRKRARRESRPHGGRRHRGGQRRADDVRRRRFPAGHSEERGHTADAVHPPRRFADDHFGDTAPERQGRLSRRDASGRHEDDQAVGARRVQAERGEELVDGRR